MKAMNRSLMRIPGMIRRSGKAGVLLACLLVGADLSAQRLWVRVSAGGESQDFRWSIAGNPAGQDPNIYSELTWHAVSGPVGQAALEWRPAGRWRVIGSGSRVFTRSGTMTDTDYGLDNRYDPIYHQTFAVNTGHSESLAAAVGYSVWNKGRWRLTPFIGYAIDQQYFPVTDPGGPYEGLNSSYAAKWLGPLIKVDGSWQLSGRWQVVADVTYHQVRYHATADWNLIPEFAHPVSFRHTADGYGIETEAGLRYTVGRIGWSVRGGYFDWETGTGIDQLYLSTGASDQTQLNGVGRQGWRAVLGVEVGLF
jgi:outer membrane protease